MTAPPPLPQNNVETDMKVLLQEMRTSTLFDSVWALTNTNKIHLLWPRLKIEDIMIEQ